MIREKPPKGLFLLLYFLVGNSFTEGRVELLEFDLAFNLLLIFTAEIHVVRLR